MVVEFRVDRTHTYREALLEEISIQIRKYEIILSIFVDPEAENPREWLSNQAKLILFGDHRRIGDPHDFSDPYDFLEWVEHHDPKHRMLYVVKVYEGTDNVYFETLKKNEWKHVEWEANQIGYMYVDLVDLYRSKGYLKPFCSLNAREHSELAKEAFEIVVSEIENLRCYLGSGVFCYAIACYEKVSDRRRELVNLFDSCGGIFGTADLSRMVYSSLAHILRALRIDPATVNAVLSDVHITSEYLEPPDKKACQP